MNPETPMTPLAILGLVLAHGPSVISLIVKLRADVASGKKEVTEDDWKELDRLANQKGEDIYLRLGITPPPPAAP